MSGNPTDRPDILECHGPELPATLARIKAAGGNVRRIDVVKVSCYRLHVTYAEPQTILNLDTATVIR